MHSSGTAVYQGQGGGGGGSAASSRRPTTGPYLGHHTSKSKSDPRRKHMAYSKSMLGADPMESQYEQDLEFVNTQRQLNYRRRKEEMKKKLHRLKKLQKLREEAEETGEIHDKTRFTSFLPFAPVSQTGQSENADRISTASVMEERIQEVLRELAQVEHECQMDYQQYLSTQISSSIKSH
ncbi:uncharacterized protein LOC131877914 isoform X2 [Tigriopus californicus]|uniref:uncharacterized protein LOC131877914 isoform X2 n=1 Tax=Tigriopus californicus TaxID=6832 RepID=UPI0027D9D53C|nr:uncharacterized protein LOC131877914 isoform X2 [Tigriopus californicus]